MFRVLLLLLISANLPFAYCQDNELDCPYFGLEFVDVDGAIKISGIDVDIPSAKKLQVNDVVLTANESKFETAADLNAFLISQDDGVNVRFEVLALSDKAPRSVSVRPDTLRKVIPKRFTKQRDKQAKEIVYVSVFPAEQVHLAVVQDFAGKSVGLRLRFYPKNSMIEPGNELQFRENPSLGRQPAFPIATRDTEFHYSNISAEDERKIPSLSESNKRVLLSKAYIELGSDRTPEILNVLQSNESVPWQIGYNVPRPIVGRWHRLTSEETRNWNSCRLLYQILSKESEDSAK